jgi:hypothetical protein
LTGSWPGWEPQARVDRRDQGRRMPFADSIRLGRQCAFRAADRHSRSLLAQSRSAQGPSTGAEAVHVVLPEEQIGVRVAKREGRSPNPNHRRA